MNFRKSLLIVLLCISGYACTDEPETVNLLAPNSPVGDLSFSSWDEVDNVLVIRTGCITDTAYCDSSSNAYALFFRSTDDSLYLRAASTVSLNSEQLNKSDDYHPIYFSEDDMGVIGSGQNGTWSISIDDSTYSISHALAKRGTSINITPYTSISIGTGFNLTWNYIGGNDSVVVKLAVNESLTEYHDSTYTPSGVLHYAIKSEDDDGSVSFSSGDLANFLTGVYGELMISWYRFAASTAILNNTTFLGSVYTLSIPVYISD